MFDSKSTRVHHSPSTRLPRSLGSGSTMDPNLEITCTRFRVESPIITAQMFPVMALTWLQAVKIGWSRFSGKSLRRGYVGRPVRSAVGEVQPRKRYRHHPTQAFSVEPHIYCWGSCLYTFHSSTPLRLGLDTPLSLRLELSLVDSLRLLGRGDDGVSSSWTTLLSIGELGILSG